MMSVWFIIAKLVESIASFGAGAASAGYSYEPKIPAELQN